LENVLYSHFSFAIYRNFPECPVNLPSNIQLTSNTGEVITATGTDITDPGGGERERIFRGAFNQPLTSVSVTNLNGCSDVVSITLSVESELENSASFLVEFNRELDGRRAGEVGFSVNVGSEPNDRDFTISIPVHEKDASGANRAVRYTVSSGSNTFTDTRTDQNAGPEASLYEATITVPTCQSEPNIC